MNKQTRHNIHTDRQTLTVLYSAKGGGGRREGGEKKKTEELKTHSTSRKAGRRSSESLEQFETGPF